MASTSADDWSLDQVTREATVARLSANLVSMAFARGAALDAAGEERGAQGVHDGAGRVAHDDGRAAARGDAQGVREVSDEEEKRCEEGGVRREENLRRRNQPSQSSFIEVRLSFLSLNPLDRLSFSS